MAKKNYGIEEYLSGPKRLEEEVRKKEDHIASLRSIVERTTARLSLTAGRNPSKDDKQFEGIMAEIADEEKALAELRQQLLKLQQEIERFIDSQESKDHRVFLRLMYIRGKSMKEIRSIMGLPKTTCFDLQRRALREAESKFRKAGKK